MDFFSVKLGGPSMGPTAILGIDNRSSSPVRVLDGENVGAPGSGTVVGPGQTLTTVNMWVPWANSAQDFAQHRLELQIAGATRYCSWQSARPHGDFVRV